MQTALVVMGVAGCGKSSQGQRVAHTLGCAFIEGDDFHSEQSRHKMAHGTPLTDADRSGWLLRLGQQIHQHPQGLVLTCSALKKSYRNSLRQSAADAGLALQFVFLEIDKPEAQRRVSARGAASGSDPGGAHFFSASLVDSQFETLEPPVGEAGVLRLDATLPLAVLVERVVAWVISLQLTH